MNSPLRSQPICDQTAFLSVGNALGVPGQIVRVPLNGSSACEVTGFALAVGYDTQRLAFNRAVPGAFLLDHAGLALSLEYSASEQLGFLTVFVILDFSPSQVIPPTSIPEGTELGTLEFTVKSSAPAGLAQLRNQSDTFGRPGFPRVANIYSAPTGSPAIHPTLGSGSINVLGGGGVDCDANARLSVGSASAVSGQVQVELRGSSLCQVEGFQLAIGYDRSRVQFVRAIPGPFLQNQAGGNLLVEAADNNSSGYTKLTMLLPVGAEPTSIGSNTLLATLVYNIPTGTASGQIALRNETRTFGFPFIENVFFGESDLVEPVLQSGSITVVGQVDCDANAELKVGTATAASGEVQVQVRGSSVCKINGFSIGIGHDPSKVFFVRAAAGPFLNAHAGSDLLFRAEEHNSQGFTTIFGVFNATPFSRVPPISLPPDTVLATVTYRIQPGASGTVPLRNADQTFGTPPTPNIFTTEGVSISPVLTDGAIFIGAPGDCDGNARLTVGTASAPSGEVQVDLRGGSLCDVTGYTLAIGHDKSKVQFVSAAAGPFLDSYAGDELVFLFQPRNDQGFAVLFAAFDNTAPITVLPTSIDPNTLLATLRYSIVPGAAGQVVLQNEDQAFGFDNVFTTGEENIRPVLVDGLITIGGVQPPPPPPPPSTDFTMEIDAPPSVEFGVGQFDVQVKGSSTRGLRGFSALIAYDPDALTVVSSSFTGTVWQSADFRSVSDDGAGEIHVGVVNDIDGNSPPTSSIVSAGEDLLFLNLRFDGKCPGPTTLSFIGNIDDNTLVDEDLVSHDTGNGLALTGAAVSLEGGFVRGNANGGDVDTADPPGSVDLADGLFILAFLFQAGAPPTCEDAADSNDDGRINLLDAIYLFQFLIGGLGPELPAPYASAGVDPTQDTLNCEILSDSESCGQP